MSEYTVIIDDTPHYNVTVSGDTIEVILNDTPQVTLEVGVQGPPGISGIGKATVQDSTPLVGTEGELWFNDSTNILRIYANSDWQFQTLDDGYF